MDNFFLNINSFKSKKCIEAGKLIEEYSTNQPGAVSGVDQLNKLFSKIVFMMYNRMKIGCDLPYSNWFIDKIFYKGGIVAEFVSLNGLKNMMDDLGLVSMHSSRQITNTEDEDEARMLSNLLVNSLQYNDFNVNSLGDNNNSNEENLKQSSLTLSNLNEYDKVGILFKCDDLIKK